MRKNLIFFLVVLFSFILVSCGGTEVESISISGPAAGVVGSEITLSVTVLPEDADDKSVKWSSGDESLATVIDGKVTLLAPGSVEISAKSGNKEATHAIVISALVATESINVSGTNNGKIGEVINLTANVLPENASNKSVLWASSNDEVASVVDGVVTLNSVGEALIIASQGEIEGSLLITVEPDEVATTGIEITGLNVAEVGDTITLTAKVLPENATNKNVIWSSTDVSIATVTDGVVTVLAGGVVEIIARQGNRIIDYHEIVVTIHTESINLLEIDPNAEVGDIVALVAEVYPANATNKEIIWTTSDEEIATVFEGTVSFLKAGTVTISATQESVKGEIIFTVYQEIVKANAIDIEADDNMGVVGDEINILGRVQPLNTTFKDLTWKVDDESIASLVDGVVTLKKVGTVTVTAISKDTQENFEITAYEGLDFLWKKFTDSRLRTVKKQGITHFGSTNAVIQLYPSIFPYWFNEPLAIDKTLMLPDVHRSHPNIDVKQEWVVVHDTGNIATDAKGNATYLFNLNENQPIVSWQYTVGNDGVFQSLADTKVSWHASAGSTRTAFTDTGIPAVNSKERPRMTLSEDGYFMIKGIKTNVKAPGTTFVETGLWPVIMDGTYWIPDTSTRGTGNWIGFDGGNYEGIGIETSVYSQGDIWITWGRTAKLVADILVRNDLDVDRIVFHNSFNNKACPQAALRSGNLDHWVDMMIFEYMILTRFNDYKFDLETLTPNFLDNRGRVSSSAGEGNFVDYILKITAPDGTVKEQQFRTSIV